MDILEIISNKQDHKELTKEEIEYFVQGYTKGRITDYQAAALVMAIYLQGMTEKETTDLALAMANSGEVLHLKDKIGTSIVDKHSTGGVGDKVTLILAPIIASLGVPVAKMSGRGLGFTGGTIDKLESIPGYQTNLSVETLIKQVKKIGISLIGQTLNLAPADKKLYALRDSISCTDSIPLIASSIMSKKIAAGADYLVLDVTVGSGAFMKQTKEALKLANLMQKIGQLAGKKTVCVLTNMDQPLGYMVGNNLEVIEAIEALKGNIAEDVEEVVLELGSYMLQLAGKGQTISENKKIIKEQIQNGKAYQKLKELVAHQGGDISYIEHPEKFQKATYQIETKAEKEGIVQSLHAETIGKLAGDLGAGRKKKEDPIDNTVGIQIKKKIGDPVKKGETLAYIYANDKQKGQEVSEKLQEIYTICDQTVEKPKTILSILA